MCIAGRQFYSSWIIKSEFRKNITDSKSKITLSMDQGIDQAGYVKVPGAKRHLTEKWIRNYIKNNLTDKKDQFYSWRWFSDKTVTATAYGIDKKHHFANSYLLGFLPFKTDSVWEPVYAVAMMKTYQYDKIQYSGLVEVWQNSRQAFYYPRGDCEDHAIVLADWLISTGYDARVAVGTYNGGGHAWVVLFKNKSEYLIEATSKSKNISENLSPAFLETEYNPTMQFNRTEFWVKTDKKQTTRYNGSHWKLASHFVPI